jgi:GH25 family lysozyme M1 (1,4-beta-N-acetylmuramidase)
MKTHSKLIHFSKLSTLQWMATVASALAMAFSPSHALAQRPLGIDVSSYQGGSINWGSVRGAGITFAWAKATEGATIADPDFVGNEANGKAAGVYMGAYHFAHPNLNSPATEAAYFWSHAGAYIKADGKSFMPMLDMEVFDGLVGAATYSAWANDWCADVVAYAAEAGIPVKPVIYVSACNACYFDSSVSQWTSDLADYNGESPQTGTPWSTCTSCEVWGAGAWSVWQYSDAGSVSGIPTTVDLDVFNGSLSGLVISSTALKNRVGMAATPASKGYWIVASDGGVFSFGNAQFYGSMGGQKMNAPVVGMAARPQGDGYWLVGSDGGIFTFGNAGYYGSMGGQKINAPIVAVCSTADGAGYWEVGADGGIYTFGDAPFHGSMGGDKLNAPVVGMAATSGNGYWLVGSDGGIYSFDATFYGSMGGTTLSAPVVGMSAYTTGSGYWLVGSDGATYCFGSSGYHGGMNGTPLAAPMVGITGTSDGGGYWQVGGDGGIFTFGDAPYYGGANFSN